MAKKDSKEIRKEGARKAGKALTNSFKSGTNMIGNAIKTASVKKGVASLIGDAVKAIPNTLKDGLDLISGSKQMLFNHPGWYTNYSTSNLVQINLANKQNVEYDALVSAFNVAEDSTTGSVTRIKMPAVTAMFIQLLTPKGDDEGWRTGVRLLWQQLRTANSGKINFTATDLEHYIQNVRALHATYAWLNRLYKFTYTFRSTNAEFPRNFIEATGVDFDNIMSNAADLFMYIQRYAQQIHVSFPLNVNYYDRTYWLFSNVFVDSDSTKPSFIVPTLQIFKNNEENRIGSIIYYTNSGFNSSTVGYNWTQHRDVMYSVDGKPLTYAQLTSQLDRLKSALINDSAMALIAGDIIKAFGDRAFYNVPVCNIDDGVTAIYDQDALCQFQNSTVMGFCPIGNSGIIPDIFYEYVEEQDANGWITGHLQTDIDIDTHNAGKVYESVKNTIIDKYKNYLLTWHDDKISSGQLMSMTRLNVGDPKWIIHQSGDKQLQAINWNVYGTEAVTGYFQYYQNDQYNFSSEADDGTLTFYRGNNYLKPYAGFVYGLLDTTNPEVAYNQYLMQLNDSYFLWSNTDWSPRLVNILLTDEQGLIENSTLAGVSPQILDYDVFALTDGSQQSIYFSYGNQSLLYAGASQNQSNTSTYKRSTGRDAQPKGSSRERASLEADKR